MEPITIYHNGSCSKCHGALELLEENGIPYTARWYLAEPLSRNELAGLLQRLGLPAIALVRAGEPLYKEQFEGKDISNDEWLDILVSYPELMQRPIVEQGGRAVIARPAEKMFDILFINED